MASSLNVARCSAGRKSIWSANLARAKELTAGSANPLLTRYIELVSLQAKLSSILVGPLETSPKGADRALISYFDQEALAPLLELAAREITPNGQSGPTDESLGLLERLWHQVEEFTYPRDLAARLVLEVFATELAALPHREMETMPDRCPHCGFPVLCSIAREESMGLRRSVRCSICSGERAAPRLGCLRCGEERASKLPVFSFDAWPHIRVDLCDSCGGYLKLMDMTKDAEALPVPDDIASSAINIWAFEQGYEPIGRHLFKM